MKLDKKNFIKNRDIVFFLRKLASSALMIQNIQITQQPQKKKEKKIILFTFHYLLTHE